MEHGRHAVLLAVCRLRGKVRLAAVAAQVRPTVEAADSHMVVGAVPFPFVGRAVRRQLPLLLLPLLVAEAAVEAPLPTSLAGIRSLVTIRP